MRPNLTHAIEDYLKAIYELSLSDGRATTNQIAERLEVTPASVTGMIKRLAATEPALLLYQKHHGVELTEAGEKVALEIIRHHRLLELFLHETLGFSWDEVHEEADRLEHVISETLEERIATALGDPTLDPHGAPIPTKELNLPPQVRVRLMMLREGQEAVVQRVEDDDPELLRYLETIGLVPLAQVEVIERSVFDDNLRLLIDDREVVLGPRVTEQVYVEVK
jgi:DtxR family Mn-dependent transcriptional regulator